MSTLKLNSQSKKKLKIILCGTGIVIAMSLAATTPSLSQNSINNSVKPKKAAALNAPGRQKSENQQGGIDLSSASTGSLSPAGDYKLQGTGPASPPAPSGSSDSDGNSSSPVTPVPPVTEPDPLYPIDPTPKCHIYKYPGGMQPMSCPVCEAYPAADGVRYPCGPCYGGPGVDIMCAMHATPL